MKGKLLAFSLLLFAFATNVAVAETSIGSVEYWDSYYETMRESDAERTYLLTPETTTLSDDCWYVVDGEVTVNETICLENTAYIILKDGAKLTVNSDVDTHPGIRVRYGYSNNDDLYIYGQKFGTGELRERCGNFFYRFPEGESCADVYDRMCSFLESLFRQFERPDSPENIIIVSHGTAIKCFLMRWHHWTVDKFESLPNMGNCEMGIIDRSC